jgi:hypothetical protein
VHIAKPGTVIYEIHIYQGFAIKRDRQYTFTVWLRASDNRTIEIQAVHQAPPWTIYGGDAAASDRILALGAERGLHIGTPPVDLPWPQGDKGPDYAGPDSQIDHILAIDPKALIIPRIHLDAPDWWKKAHPGQTMVYADKAHPATSAASKLWRRDAADALRLFLRHLESKYGDHMLGYHVTGQSAGEWFYYNTWEPIMPCFEEPFRQGFAEWARGKYQTAEALRRAWGQPQVTFETVRVPTLEERTRGRLGAFRDPTTQRFEVDFAEYMQGCLCECVEEFARIVKEETGGRKLSVFFYGYLYDVAGFPYGGAVSGHLRLRRVLSSPHVDVVCSPISYNDRQSGGVGPFMAPVDSIQAHGKLWFNEDDTRTHLAPADAGFGRTDDLLQTLGVYRRNFGHQFERRCGTWWMDFGTGWMADRAIFDCFAQARDIWRAAPKPGPFQPQVAIVTDEDSFLYLRHSNEISGPSVSAMRRMFNTIGCPVGLYLMADVCEGKVPEAVRLYVFLNAYRVTGEQRQQLRARVARDRKTALWLYAPGFISEDASAANVADLIGFQVAALAEPTSARIRLPASPPAPLDRLANHTFGVESRPTPLFAVAPGQADVIPLGTYAGTPHLALAMKRTPAWASVFCGGLQVSAEVLRELARDAGAHVYCETNDVINGCPGFLSIHATTAGEKTLLFPSPVRLRDLVSGETLHVPTRNHRITLRAGETRLFAY